MKRLSLTFLLILSLCAYAFAGPGSFLDSNTHGFFTNYGGFGGTAPVVISYDLNAPFTADNQTFSNAQVLDTVAEGITTGSLTVVETSTGSVKIASNLLEITGSGAWDATGVRETTGVTKALGNALFGTLTHNTLAASLFGVNTAAGIVRANGMEIEFDVSENLTVVADGASASHIVVGAVVDATAYKLLVLQGGYDTNGIPFITGDTVGDFTFGMHYFIKDGTFTNWTRIWMAPTDNTATLYSYAQVLEASAVNYDTFLDPTTVLDVDTMFQPQFLATFTGTNDDQLVSAYTPEVGGANAFESGSTTWTIQSNTANNDPGLEASLWDAPAAIFTGAGTYAWVAQGTNTIANDANSLKITFGNSSEGAIENLNNAADLTSDLTVGKIYKYGGDAKVGAGDSVQPIVKDGVASVIVVNLTQTNFTAFSMYFSAKHATNCDARTRLLGTGEEIWFDNLFLQEVTLNEQFATDDLGITEGIFDVDVTIPTFPDGMAGLVLALDDKDTPTNFIQVYFNRAAGNGAGTVELWKAVAGTYTNLINTTATYAAGAQLRAIVDYVTATDDVKVKVYYNGVLIGTEQSINDNGIAGNVRHGIMNVDTSNSLDNFTVHSRTDSAWDTEISTATESVY